jgi:hypothetical protein
VNVDGSLFAKKMMRISNTCLYIDRILNKYGRNLMLWWALVIYNMVI